MKKIKKIKTIISSLVILLVVIVVGFFFLGNSLIKKGIESAGTKTLGVNVGLDYVKLSLLASQIKLGGLVIDNPSGYQNKTLLNLKDGTVKLNVRSLTSETVEINNIKLDGAALTIEQKGLTNNLKEILDNLPKGEKPQKETKSKKLVVNKLEITNTKVTVKLLPVPGRMDNITMNIDPIVMTDLGSDSKLDAGILIAKILTAIATGVARQGVGIIPDDMLNGIGSALGQAADFGKGAIEGGKKVIESTDGLINSIGGLLGGKEEDKKK